MDDLAEACFSHPVVDDLAACLSTLRRAIVVYSEQTLRDAVQHGACLHHGNLYLPKYLLTRCHLKQAGTGCGECQSKAPPNTWREQETGHVFFRNDCSSQQCVATLFSRHPHDDGDAMPTCAHDEHTQQHVMLVLCGGLGKLLLLSWAESSSLAF